MRINVNRSSVSHFSSPVTNYKSCVTKNKNTTFRSQENRNGIKFSNLFARITRINRRRPRIFEDRLDLRYAILVETRCRKLESSLLCPPGQRPFIRNPIDCSNRDRAVCNCFLRMLQLPLRIGYSVLRRAQKLGKNRSTQRIVTVRGKAPFQAAKLFPLMNRDTFFRAARGNGAKFELREDIRGKTSIFVRREWSMIIGRCIRYRRFAKQDVDVLSSFPMFEACYLNRVFFDDGNFVEL